MDDLTLTLASGKAFNCIYVLDDGPETARLTLAMGALGARRRGSRSDARRSIEGGWLEKAGCRALFRC